MYPGDDKYCLVAKQSLGFLFVFFLPSVFECVYVCVCVCMYLCVCGCVCVCVKSLPIFKKLVFCCCSMATLLFCACKIQILLIYIYIYSAVLELTDPGLMNIPPQLLLSHQLLLPAAANCNNADDKMKKMQFLHYFARIPQ